MAEHLKLEINDREAQFYLKIRQTFCEIVDPLPLSDYLVEQNCFTETDLARNFNKNTVSCLLFLFFV